MASTYKSIRDIDWPLLLITLAISAVGILQIYSATHETKWQDAWWKQIVWIGAGLVLFWIVSQIDYPHAAGSGVPDVWTWCCWTDRHFLHRDTCLRFATVDSSAGRVSSSRSRSS